jgi:transposase-like protein
LNKNDVLDYLQDIKDNNKSVGQKADELGVPRSTLYSAIARAQSRTRKKPGPKPKVTVVDLTKKAETKARSIPELLESIDADVAQLRKILGLK